MHIHLLSPEASGLTAHMENKRSLKTNFFASSENLRLRIFRDFTVEIFF